MAKICVAVCGFSEHELELFGAVVGLPILNGEANLEEGQVFLSDLENTKGFEFQCMVVVNCAVGVIPYPRSPEEETFRDLSRLYVAMTRARHQLVISHSGEPSKFVASQKERFAIDSWQSYLGTFAVPEEFELPAKLEQLRSDGKKSDVLSMTGEEYLYTEHALNCSSILIEKLRALVRGHSKTTSAGVAIEWRTLRDAVRDTRNQVRSRQVFGPEGYRLFRERFDAMLGNQPREIRLR